MCCPCFAGVAKEASGGQKPRPVRFDIPPETDAASPGADVTEALQSWTPSHHLSGASKKDLFGRGADVGDDVVKGLKDHLSRTTSNRSLKKRQSMIQAHAGLTRLDAVLRHQQNRGGAGRPIEDFYEKVAKLGEGAFGSVTKWRTKTRDGCKAEEVAVKHIGWKSKGGFNWGVDESQVQELKQELMMLVVLDNPFIIDAYEWFEHPSKGIFFVMELCEQGSLQDLLEECCGVADVVTRQENYKERLRRHFRQVTYALAYLHGMNPPIVHRDLKPENCLLRGSGGAGGTIKLIDFGLTIGDPFRRQISRGEELATNEKWGQGTQVFMAPEQFLEPAGRFTADMDIWALGVMLGWIMTAIHLGSMQHPMLPLDVGKDFTVRFYTLMCVYRDFQEGKLCWNKSLLEGQVSARVIDLFDRILVFEADKRFHASDVIDHDWVSAGDPAKKAMLMDHTSLFSNIRTYHSLNKTERVILNTVAKNACANGGTRVGDRILALDRVFRGLDVNHDGMLSKEELVTGFDKFCDKDLTQAEIERIHQQMDIDGSGEVDYTEFLAASIGSAILNDEDSVSSAFRALDSKNTDFISKDDLAEAIGAQPAAEFCEAQGKDRFNYADFKELVATVADKRWTIPTCAENFQRGSVDINKEMSMAAQPAAMSFDADDDAPYRSKSTADALSRMKAH